MSGLDTVWGANHLERSTIWEDMLKEVLQDQLEAQQWVRWIDFPGGGNTTVKIPSVGEMSVSEVSEFVPIPETRPDTGNFDFDINQFVGNKVYYTDEFMEDNYLAAQVVNSTPQKMVRAIEEDLETKILGLVNNVSRGGQTQANDANTINGYAHRISGGNSGVIEVEDFAVAKLALKKANVPMTNLIAIVDPSVAYVLETATNITNISNNPQWQGIIETGMTTGMRFIRNIYGFDVYESNYLPDAAADGSALAERDGSTTNDVSSGYKTNVFFSAATPDVVPFMGAWLRAPQIESWRDSDKRADYYQMSTRYGLKIWRPESLFTVASSTDVL